VRAAAGCWRAGSGSDRRRIPAHEPDPRQDGDRARGDPGLSLQCLAFRLGHLVALIAQPVGCFPHDFDAGGRHLASHDIDIFDHLFAVQQGLAVAVLDQPLHGVAAVPVEGHGRALDA